MRRLVKKTIQVYKNQGFGAVADKGVRFAVKRLRRASDKLRFKRVSYDQKRLQEEYAFVSNDIFQITEDDIKASQKACSRPRSQTIQTATWFVPYFDHFGFNGIQTIFRFIEKMSKEGVRNRIVIFDNPAFNVEVFEKQMKESFPGIEDYEIIVLGEDKLKGVRDLPESDIAFCTIWMSAYILLRYNKTRRKYYFIQDYEPMFYEAGSTSALAQSTYRFGFTGVVNTPGLLAAVNQRDGLEGMSFIPTVNLERYHPDPALSQSSSQNPGSGLDPNRKLNPEPGKKTGKKVRIFLYARPLNPRNAFNLGILTIKLLLDKYGKKIEIITAGANWNEAEYGLQGKITNLGLLKSLDEVADLYRTCDIGFSYMLTPHTSYQMLEYSASGMATVMNRNVDHLWLHKDGVNCLLAEPSPADMAEKIGWLIDDPALRARLVKAAQKELYYTWDQQMDMLWNEVANSKD